MKCNFNNSLSQSVFGFGAKNMPAQQQNQAMKNEALNFGVVVPPDKLPNASYPNAINSKPPKEPIQKTGGGKTLNAGIVSAGCAFLAMGLSAISMLPVIRKH